MSKAAAYVNFQQRALEFSPGDAVFPFMGGNSHLSGRVVAVWPSIGMVDVEWPHGSERMPVEDLQRQTPDGEPLPENNNVPGGSPADKTASLRRLGEAFVKKAIYWASVDRKYKASRAELDSGNFHCPKCREGTLRKAVYKRAEGASDRLFGCPSCLFLIKACDIVGGPDWQDPSGATLTVDDENHILAAKKDDDKEADWDGKMDQGFDSLSKKAASVDASLEALQKLAGVI